MSTERDRARERKNERRRKRYAENPEHRKRRLDSSDRYRVAHRAKINAQRRHRWATDPDYRARVLAELRKLHRKMVLRRHGMSLEEYERLLALQGGVCAICQKAPRRGLLCVDHCHRTGMIRGLLCAKCNSGLGFYDDDPNRTQAATHYLRAAYARLRRWRGFEPTGHVMIPTDETETGKDGTPMRGAILLELRRPPGEADDGAADKLRLIARRLVDKAAEGDLQAIKEVLDRIDGKTVAQAGDAEEGPRQVNIRWKDAASVS
jgi:hypothetical protein